MEYVGIYRFVLFCMCLLCQKVVISTIHFIFLFCLPFSKISLFNRLLVVIHQTSIIIISLSQKFSSVFSKYHSFSSQSS